MIKLDTIWLSGDDVFWTFDRPTLVTGFEIRNGTKGTVLSISIGNYGQLAGDEGDGLPIETFSQEGMHLEFPRIEIGEKLELILNDFDGEIRPIGVQA